MKRIPADGGGGDFFFLFLTFFLKRWQQNVKKKSILAIPCSEFKKKNLVLTTKGHGKVSRITSIRASLPRARKLPCF